MKWLVDEEKQKTLIMRIKHLTVIEKLDGANVFTPIWTVLIHTL